MKTLISYQISTVPMTHILTSVTTLPLRKVMEEILHIPAFFITATEGKMKQKRNIFLLKLYVDYCS